MDKYKILIIEDDQLLVNMYKTKFEAEGFDVVVANDGASGLAAAATYKPNAIVLDIMMPKLSGIDFLRELGKDDWLKSIPVLVLTNLSQQDEAKKAIELGAKEYLLKASLTPGQVVDKVRTYLQQNPNQ
jgi:DNA-binding response OmpR family regulator